MHNARRPKALNPVSTFTGRTVRMQWYRSLLCKQWHSNAQGTTDI